MCPACPPRLSEDGARGSPCLPIDGAPGAWRIVDHDARRCDPGSCSRSSPVRWRSPPDARRCSAGPRATNRSASATRLQEIQLKVMRYADDYGGRMRDPLAELSAAVQLARATPQRPELAHHADDRGLHDRERTQPRGQRAGHGRACDIEPHGRRTVLARLARRDAGARSILTATSSGKPGRWSTASSTPNRPLSCTG